MKLTETRPWLKYYFPEDLERKLEPMSIMDYLEIHCRNRVNRVALKYLDVDISVDQLFENIYKTANAYYGLGVRRGDYVVVVSATTPEIVYTFYALSLIGATPNMVDPRFSPDVINGFINEVGAKWVVTILNTYPKVVKSVAGTGVKNTIVFPPVQSLPEPIRTMALKKNPMPESMPEGFITWDDLEKLGEGVSFEHVHDRANECCVIVHTGGTTGPSKSVMLSDWNINNISFEYHKFPIHVLNKDKMDKFLDVMPPFIAYGFGYGIHLPLCNDMVSIIIPSLDPKELGKLILKYKPQEIAGVPFHWQVLMEDPLLEGQDLSFLTKPCAGGDAIALPVEEEINAWLKAHNAPYKITKGYGMTELSALSTACAPNINKLGSVGIPHADFLIAAFDPETNQELDAGTTGEICICGPSMMLGYYGKPEETAHVIREHEDGRKWVHTGDLGYVDEDGCVFILGRSKRMFMDYFGFKVFPSVVEDAVEICNDVEFCCAVPARDKNYDRGYVPYVFYTVKPGTTKTEEEINAELKAICEEKIVEYMMPRYFKQIAFMPRTPVGKTDYKKLEDIAHVMVGD